MLIGKFIIQLNANITPYPYNGKHLEGNARVLGVSVKLFGLVVLLVLFLGAHLY